LRLSQHGPQHGGGQRFSITTLATHLPARERKSLLTQLTQPLAATTLPEPDDLSGFWLEAEEAIRSLDETLADLNLLTDRHMRQLAPVLLGVRGWQHF
jgi:hypothetical protein